MINVARGGVIEDAALVEALDAGIVKGAALDVFEIEPPAKDNPLVGRPDVICTPHLGASTTEAQEAVAVEIAEAVVGALQGELAATAVNAPMVPALGSPQPPACAFGLRRCMQLVTISASVSTCQVSGEVLKELSPYVGLVERLGARPLPSLSVRVPPRPAELTLASPALRSAHRCAAGERRCVGRARGVQKQPLRRSGHAAAARDGGEGPSGAGVRDKREHR